MNNRKALLCSVHWSDAASLSNAAVCSFHSANRQIRGKVDRQGKIGNQLELGNQKGKEQWRKKGREIQFTVLFISLPVRRMFPIRMENEEIGCPQFKLSYFFLSYWR